MSNIVFTNKENLPLPIQIWLASSDYDFEPSENTISVTSLMKPVQMIVLGRRYKDQPRQADFSDFIASTLGSSIHASIEKSLSHENMDKMAKALGITNIEAIKDKLLIEQRNVRDCGDYHVSGKFDMVFDGTVIDVKSTSVWKWIMDDIDDHRMQLSEYKWLNPGLITNEYGYIFFVFTDWSKAESKRKADYPKSRIMVKKIKLFTEAEIQTINETKLAQVKKHEATPEPMLPQCTPEERWERPTTWKYYKNPSKLDRSTKNFDNAGDAYARQAKEGGMVVKAPGVSVRCSYCSVANFCAQYAELKLDGLIED